MTSKKRRGRGYPQEYRDRLVELVRSGRSAESLGREFEPCAETIRKWVVRAEMAKAGTDGQTDQTAEVKRLRRENARLREEREILKKAAAWFAMESDSSRA